MARINIVPGTKFERLTALGDTGERVKYPSGDCVPLWIFQRDCGRVKIIRLYNVTSGASRSCGCLRKEITGEMRKTHGARLPDARPGLRGAYISWASMHTRCKNPNRAQWKDYGGRGITVCRRWSGREGFAHFLMDMGERPEGTTLDRIENDGNYEPGNCRWADDFVQNQNRRSCQPPEARPPEFEYDFA